MGKCFLAKLKINLEQNDFAYEGVDKTDIAIKSIDNAKIAMTQNMQNLLARDEKLDTMLRKTQDMSDLSYSISKKVLLLFKSYY